MDSTGYMARYRIKLKLKSVLIIALCLLVSRFKTLLKCYEINKTKDSQTVSIERNKDSGTR